MRETTIRTNQAILNFGHGVANITPPVGIYHRMFGAASHERSTGVHRPLQADVMAVGPADGESPLFVRVQMDHVGFAESQHEQFIHRVSEASGVAPDQVVIGYSHSHAAGWYAPDRIPLPGGELIEAYIAEIGEKLAEATRAAMADRTPAVFGYATGRCDLAANRDCWDDEAACYVCGFNPGEPADEELTMVRITSPSGPLRASLVHYACHPTTLGWENTLISPDFVGAMRDVVTAATGKPCIYFQGACGDLGPREGFVGDPAVADRNGRKLGYAALSTLETLGPSETDYQYTGPVVSGATLGSWAHVPIDPQRRTALTSLGGARFNVELPLKPQPDPLALEVRRSEWEQKAADARARGDAVTARDCRAHAERAKRWIARLADLPAGDTAELSASVHRLGESLWITTGGEPYNWLGRELRSRFPGFTVLFSPLAGDFRFAYMLPKEEYGKGLYQEEPSPGAPGCLEKLCDALTDRVREVLADTQSSHDVSATDEAWPNR